MLGCFGILVLFCTLGIVVNGTPRFDDELSEDKDTWSSKYQPYTAAIKCDNRYTCTGTIISPTKILTAAYCALLLWNTTDISKPKLCKNFTVYVGSANLHSGGQDFEVKSIEIPDGYYPDKFAREVAVLTLTSAIKFSENQKPIELPDKDIISNSIGVTSGWGVNYKSSTDLEDTLQVSKKIIITADQCNAKYFEDEKVFVDINDFCGVTYGYNPGFCSGHGGSPMIQDGKIIGIVSWGKSGCNHENVHGYTNVYRYLDFIKKQLQ